MTGEPRENCLVVKCQFPIPGLAHIMCSRTEHGPATGTLTSPYSGTNKLYNHEK